MAIPFLLWNAKTRLLAFFGVVVFHWLTWVLFPIGVFPWVMIGSALIFFDATRFRKFLGQLKPETLSLAAKSNTFAQKIGMLVIATFLFFQLLFPFRHLLYKGELFWTEEGYRFSWRVMLMEKAGYAMFKVVDADTGKRFYVQNGNFLNPLQEKQMATQADFILEYAHYLENFYQKKGIRDPEIYVESYVALNGRSSQPFVNPEIDLTKIKRSWKPIHFLLPFNDEIKGF